MLFPRLVPLLHLQVAINDLIPRDPCILRWVEVMARHGGGGPIITYGLPFFRWLCNQLLMIEGYAYVGTDFWGHPNLALPEGEKWGDLGKREFFVFWIFMYFIIFHFFVVLRPYMLLCRYIPSSWPVGSSPIERQGADKAVMVWNLKAKSKGSRRTSRDWQWIFLTYP